MNANDDSGQVIYTGNDDIEVRSCSGPAAAAAGLCFYSQRKPATTSEAAFRTRYEGLAIDGGKQLWVADATTSGVLQVPVNSPTATGSGIYLNSNGVLNIPAQQSSARHQQWRNGDDAIRHRGRCDRERLGDERGLHYDELHPGRRLP